MDEIPSKITPEVSGVVELLVQQASLNFRRLPGNILSCQGQSGMDLLDELSLLGASSQEKMYKSSV